MGNITSIASVKPTHTFNHIHSYSTPLFSETSRTFSVSTFEPSTFVSITKGPTRSFSSESPLTRTGEYCSWNWESDTSSCSSWTYTIDATTSFTTSTPPGGYETSAVSFTFPDYTCTNFACINSVASFYGFSLCMATPTTSSGFPTIVTPSRTEETYTSNTQPTFSLTCDPILDWRNCPGTISETWYTSTESWPTISWSTTTSETTSWPTQTTPDCEETETAASTSSVTPACGFETDCQHTLDSAIPASLVTSILTPTKNTYSYHSGDDTRPSSTSTLSDCDFWDEDCMPAAAAGPTNWDPDSWSTHTITMTVPFPLHSDEAKE
ncbi:hypothetical protein GGS21DRAFT_544592 [Xylaria nigripes]|nr:hypothetical protein GGS21DRAFT_544592 [Xylaria nigripes]